MVVPSFDYLMILTLVDDNTLIHGFHYPQLLIVTNDLSQSIKVTEIKCYITKTKEINSRNGIESSIASKTTDNHITMNIVTIL